jgi:hypothetical protein
MALRASLRTSDSDAPVKQRGIVWTFGRFTGQCLHETMGRNTTVSRATSLGKLVGRIRALAAERSPAQAGVVAE